MASQARSRSTRDRPAKPPLSESAIVDTALAILREEGLEAVTMRRVATELDTGAASLYVYVKGRDELRDLMLDRVVDASGLPAPDPDRWREQVHAELRRWLDAMLAHPGIAMVAVANPPTSESTLFAADRLIGLLLLGGAAPQDAAWAGDILPMIVTMTAIERDAHRTHGHSEAEVVGSLDRAFSSLDPERFPNLTRYKDEMISGSGDARFTFAVDVILDGLVARGRANT